MIDRHVRRLLNWISKHLLGEPRIIYKTPEDEGVARSYIERHYVFPRERSDCGDRKFPFRIMLHEICQSDTDRHLHDHPWSFISLILAGSYTEQVPHPEGWPHLTNKKRNPGSVALRFAEALHRVKINGDKSVWTLVLCGPRRRDWGYLTERGWVHWEDYWGER